jgi:cytochrome c oxidase subunit II
MNELLREILLLPPQASTMARDIDYLHYFVIITTMVGAAGVAALALYYIVRYREGAGRGHDPLPDPRPLHARGGVSLWSELALIGGLLALFVTWWIIGFCQFIRIIEPPADSMTIYVVGKQWMWSFAYPNGGGSVGVLYVPARRPVKLLLTSRDVIHSFYAPDFRLKTDVVPGRTTQLWFEVKEPGRHPIYCAEMCGAGHSVMRSEVVALSDAEYERTLEGLAPLAIAGPVQGQGIPFEAEPREPLSLAAIGRRVAAEAGCLRCHTVDGTPHIGPTWAGLYDAVIPLANGTPVRADDAYLTRSMMDPAVELHRGFPAVMPSYQGLLTAPQLGAIVEYLHALRDVRRDEGAAPLPAPVSGPVPLVTPLVTPLDGVAPGEPRATEPGPAGPAGGPP